MKAHFNSALSDINDHYGMKKRGAQGTLTDKNDHHITNNILDKGQRLCLDMLFIVFPLVKN